MAQSYDRRINLYINGREVQNNIASIRKEMFKLTNEQARMTIGSREYQQHAAQIKRLKGIMAQHVHDVNNIKKGWSMKGVADGFNRYFAMVTAAMASFAGAALTIKSAVQAFAEFDDKLADVMKTTGLTKDQVKTLNGELKKIDTRSAQTELLDLARVAGKLGITAEDEILGFVRAADKIKVALSEDLGGDVEESINQLGKLVDIFKLKDEFGIEDALIKIGSAINSLGAAGTANEAYMVEFSKRLAGIAPAAGMSIQEVLGLAATLDELGQTSEVSGTAIVQVIGKMFKDTAAYANIAGMSIDDFTKLLNTDANEAFIKLLEGARGSGTGFGEMAKNLQGLGLDGARSTAVLGVLANNIDKLREKQAFSNSEFEKGTSIITEFNTKNESAQAQLEKAKKGFVAMQVELGERLSPAYTSVIHKSSALLKIFGATTEFLFKYGAQLAVVLATIAAYTVATKLAALWQTRFSSATLLSVASQKLQAMAFKAQFAGIALYNSVIALLTGKLKVAAIQFRAFSAALMANPIGIVVGVVTALAGALYLYSKRMTESEKLQKTLNGVNLEAEKQIVEQRLEVEQLLKVARDDNRSKADRIAAIEQLNKISPDYLKGLSLETINTDAAKLATDKYIDSLRQKAKVQAAQEKLVEIEKELIDLQSGEGAAPNFWQQTWNAVKTGGNVASASVANAVTAGNNLIKKSKQLNLEKEKLIEITERQYNLDKTAPGSTGAVDYSAQIKAKQTELELAAKMPATTDAEIEARTKKIAAINLEIKALRELSLASDAPKDLITAKEEELEAAKQMPATTKAEIAARNKKVEAIELEIAALKELGTTKQGDSGKKQSDEEIKKRVEVIEAANNAEMAAINRRHLEGLTSDDQHKGELLAQEIKFLAEKIKVYKVGSKEYEEAVNKSLEILVTEDQRVKDLLLNEEKELSQARTENITDEFAQREAIEMQRWADEKRELEKRLIDKENLSDTEIAINDAINKTIEKKEIAHQLKMKAIKTDGNIADLQNKVTIATPVNEKLATNDQMKTLFDAKLALIEAQYDKEMQLAGDNQTAQLAADQQYAQNRFALQQEIMAMEGANIDFRIALNQAMYDQDLINAEQYQDNLTALTQEAEEKRHQIRDKYFSAANEILSGAAEIFENLKAAELAQAGDNAAKKEAIEKKYAKKQKAVAIGQAIISAAQAIIQLWAQPSIIPSPANEIYKGVMSGVIAGITLSNIAKIKSAEFSVGGPTGHGPASEPAGIVHKGERVAPHWMTTHPVLGPHIAALETVRQTKTTKSITTSPSVPNVPNDPVSSNNRQPATGNQQPTNPAIAALKTFREKRNAGPSAAAQKTFSSGGYTSSSVRFSPPSSFKEGSALDSERERGGSYSGQQKDGQPPVNVQVTTDPAILSKLDQLGEKIANLRIYTAIEDIKKGDKKYTEIQTTRGL